MIQFVGRDWKRRSITLSKINLWAVENGAVEVAQEEVHRWENPIFYEAMGEWA